MTQTMAFPIPIAIVEYLARGPRRASTIAESLAVRLKRPVSVESVRVHLATLLATGAVVRPAYGLYCLPSNAPKAVDARQWMADELRRRWPDAPDASALRREFALANGYALSFDQVDAHLCALKDDGVILRVGREGWAWDKDAAAPSLAPDPFS